MKHERSKSDAAARLIDEFIQDFPSAISASFRNELAHRIEMLLAIQRMLVEEEFKDLLDGARRAHYALQIGHKDYTDYRLQRILDKWSE
jgi:hypothetical protein